MHIGGLQKCSMIDFPPLVSCVIFTSGCNFHCPYCHNPELAAPGKNQRTFSAGEIQEFLHKRRGFLDGVVISGGEPTLQPGLADMCAHIKSLGLKLKIDTNGSRPQVIRALIKKRLADYIAMDIKTAPENYSPMIIDSIDPSVISESVRIILDSGLPHEFRTTCVRPFTNDSSVKSIAELIRGADLHAIQHPRISVVLSPGFFESCDRIHSEEELNRFRTVFAGSARQAIIR